ncbi:MAG: sporulation membrane protein YtaF [Clostridiales bacterium]|jgi:putative sporulation protein YtaF|nr:sporulation membrane protein YtaF [Clostridiales bacterium]
MPSTPHFLEAAALTAALSADAFAAAFAYGASGIKIPFKSVQVINIVCASCLVVSLLAGRLLKNVISPRAAASACFIILLALGAAKLLDCLTKSLIRKYNTFNKEIKFSVFSLYFILNLYANPEEADVDRSKTLSAGEALSLSAALSLDGLAVGVGAALSGMRAPYIIACSLIFNTLFVMAGAAAGKQARRLPADFSWLGGAVLIMLAFLKLR